MQCSTIRYMYTCTSTQYYGIRLQLNVSKMLMLPVHVLLVENHRVSQLNGVSLTHRGILYMHSAYTSLHNIGTYRNLGMVRDEYSIIITCSSNQTCSSTIVLFSERFSVYKGGGNQPQAVVENPVLPDPRKYIYKCLPTTASLQIREGAVLISIANASHVQWTFTLYYMHQ